MKTIKTILMIALFSMITISCTDLTAEDELMQHPPVEMITGAGDGETDPPPPPPPADGSTGGDAVDTGNGEGSEDGTGKGN